MPFYVPLIALAVFVLVVTGMLFLGLYIHEYYSKKMPAIAFELGLDIFLRPKDLEAGFEASSRKHGFSAKIGQEILATCRAAVTQSPKFADPVWAMTGVFNGVPVCVYTGQTTVGAEGRHIWTVVNAYFTGMPETGLVITRENILDKLSHLLEGKSDILTGNKRLDARALIKARDVRPAVKLLSVTAFQDALLRLLATGDDQSAVLTDKCALFEERGVIHSSKKLKDRLERVTDCVRAAENSPPPPLFKKERGENKSIAPTLFPKERGHGG